jgi:CspA family cold shock protein
MKTRLHCLGRGARGKRLKGMTRMAKGTVKWFNTEKGYGFIQPGDGGKDVFVHITAVQAAGLQSLKDNQPIEYELIDGRDGRKSAGALRV